MTTFDKSKHSEPGIYASRLGSHWVCRCGAHGWARNPAMATIAWAEHMEDK